MQEIYKYIFLYLANIRDLEINKKKIIEEENY